MEESEAYDHMSDAEGSEDDVDVKQEYSQTSPNGTSSVKNAPAVKANLQKRRRVTRACDECRRKKIKCDGKQPCTHCQVYSYGESSRMPASTWTSANSWVECTYDQPSNRRRNPAPQYVENLEHRVNRAETLLHILIPNLDLNDPGIDAAVAQGWIPGAPGRGHPNAARQSGPLAQSAQQAMNGLQRETEKSDASSDTNLESMVRAVAQLDVDEQGHWDYHGHSSGLSFVRRMREQLPDLMGAEGHATPFVKSRPMSQVLESPRSGGDSPAGDISPGATNELPPKAYARGVCQMAVAQAASLLRIVHAPSFWKSFEDLYGKPPEHWTNADHKFLPLFHTAMALGHLFAKDESGPLDKHGYETAIQQGFSHFKTARQLMDIADCRDLPSIQAVLFMILFLQSSAKLSQCYAYIGVALRSALRLGLHRSCRGPWNPIEAEVRKRVFWVVRKLDIYVGVMLGLPQTLNDDDIDQDFPQEVDDEYITEDGILPMPAGKVSIMTAFNLHTKLVQILSKIAKKVYPIKLSNGSPDKSYTVPFSAIREIEGELEAWKNSLPAELNTTQGTQFTGLQQLLRLAYAHAQVVLYRPFLHYVTMDKRAKPVDQRAYACAISYVNVSRNIIHIVTQMHQKGLLNGAFWFTCYTSFFAILSLVYFAAENQDNDTTQAVMKDALEGRRVLSSLARRSMAADRCTATLNSVFQSLPAWMQQGQQNPMITKKRQHSPKPSSAGRGILQATRSHPDVSATNRQQAPIGFGQVRRASTFPNHGQSIPSNGAGTPSSIDATWSQSGASSYGPQTPTSAGFDMPQTWNGSANAFSSSLPAQFAMPSQQQPGYGNNPAMNDLSMMFPHADEPLGYPNQPLTTFENDQQIFKNDGPYVAGGAPQQQSFTDVSDPTLMAQATQRSVSRAREDNLEAQFFALPPYIEQRQGQHGGNGATGPPQQQGFVSTPTGGMRPPQKALESFSMPTSMPMASGVDGGQWLRQQQQQAQQNAGMGAGAGLGSDINIQEIFGGQEWNPMLMNAFGS